MLPTDTHGGYSNHTEATKMWATAAEELCPKASNTTLQSSRGPHRHWKRAFDYRYWQLWHRGLAARYKKAPSNTRTDKEGRALCPICHACPDSGGHILGGCAHPSLKACYIKRHNEAVQIVSDALQKGQHGGCYMVADATSAADAPDYTDGTRLPRWLLPRVPDAVRKKLRPDILVIPTLPLRHVDGRVRTSAPPNRREHTIHILELGYVGDLRHDEKAAEKATQHEQLAELLTAEGWKVAYTKDHAITVGYSGTIRRQLAPLLREIGLSHEQATRCCINLHHHSVAWLNKIVALRRLLENDSSQTTG